MNEYNLFNLIVFTGPFFLSFDKKVTFYKTWHVFLKAMWLPSSIFILWDVLVTHRHWWFNSDYTGTFRLFELPLGEWLFFFTVPYACIFSWAVLQSYFNDKTLFQHIPNNVISVIFLLISVILFFFGKEYTSLALSTLAVVIFFDKWYETEILKQKLTWVYIGLIIAFTLIFNGYLTARPLVLYNYSYQLKWLIYTIPTEDFMYGLALMLWITIRYETFLKRKYDQKRF